MSIIINLNNPENHIPAYHENPLINGNRIRLRKWLVLKLTALGAGLAMGDAVALLVLITPVLFALKFRIEIEEYMLHKEFGAAYQSYCQTTWKLLPWLF